MNLAPVRIEHAHCDGARRPINVCNKRNRTDRVPGVGGEFANDVRRTVEKLDSILHCPPRLTYLRNTPSRLLRAVPSWSIPDRAALAREALETALVLGIARLRLAHEARKLFDRIDFGQVVGGFDEMSVVALAPAAKPAYHGWRSFLAARLPAA